jgi:hypothetical protein
MPEFDASICQSVFLTGTEELIRVNSIKLQYPHLQQLLTQTFYTKRNESTTVARTAHADVRGSFAAANLYLVHFPIVAPYQVIHRSWYRTAHR